MKLRILTPGATSYDVTVDPETEVLVSLDGDPLDPVESDEDGLASIPIPDGALLVSGATLDPTEPVVDFYTQVEAPDPVDLGPSWELPTTTVASILNDLRSMTLAIPNFTDQSLPDVNRLQFRLPLPYKLRSNEPFAPGEVASISAYHKMTYFMAPNSIILDRDIEAPVIRYYDTMGHPVVVAQTRIDGT